MFYISIYIYISSGRNLLDKALNGPAPIGYAGLQLSLRNGL